MIGDVFDRVMVGVTGTPGTGTISLGAPERSAVSGDCLSFIEAQVPDGSLISYFVRDGRKWAKGAHGVFDLDTNSLERDPNEQSWDTTSLTTSKLSLTSNAVVFVEAVAAVFSELQDAVDSKANRPTFSETPPSSPEPGDRWINSADGVESICFDDGTSVQWFALGGAGGGITGTVAETVFPIVDGGSVSISPANGSIQTWTLGANRSPTFNAAWQSGQAITLMVDDGSAYTITWPTISWQTASGSAPGLKTSGYTTIVLWKIGSTYYGSSPNGG